MSHLTSIFLSHEENGHSVSLEVFGRRDVDGRWTLAEVVVVNVIVTVFGSKMPCSLIGKIPGEAAHRAREWAAGLRLADQWEAKFERELSLSVRGYA